mmetsp:Transcript_29148/g.28018  ORF Transcript_29148/g.28018 Transcript_29148/m.28018 type:complete len:95 (+) Transcript_29148:58-342(+)
MFNNAIRNVTRPLIANQRRLQSSKSECSTTFLTANKKETFSKNFLSDPATYPIIVVLGAAGALCAGFATYCLTCNNDVRINPTRRNSILRTWGN